MQKKLTISVDQKVYDEFGTPAGRKRIGRVLESIAQPRQLAKELDSAYRQMAGAEIREAEALEWANATCRDVANETR